MVKKLCAVAMLGLLVACLAGCNSQAAQPGAQEEPAVYDVEFHRGCRDARPENTLYAFQYALEHNAPTIECDINLTKDGVLVISHNMVLNPALAKDEDGNYVEADRYVINQMTLEEVQSFNVGHIDEKTDYYDLHGRTQITADAHIPTLRDLFELVRDSGDTTVRMSIEAKACPDPAVGINYKYANTPDEILVPLNELVKEFDFENRVILQSFDWEFLKQMQKINPNIETIALYNEEPSWNDPEGCTLWLDRQEASPWLGGLNIHDFDDDPVKAAHSLGINAVSPYYGAVDEALVQEAHSLGMKVVPWTLNDAESIAHMYDIGVDGIVTDQPWVAYEVLGQKGVKLPETREVNLPYHLDGDHVDVESDDIDNARAAME